MRPQPLRTTKALVFTACLLPLARLLVLGITDGLGVDPAEFVARSTGTWALVLLCLTLSVTPMRRITGWSSLIRLRRMLGLQAFFYGCLHLLSYLWLEQRFEALAIIEDVLERPFITLGMVAFLLMLALALTSTNAMRRRMGRHWSELHRAIYAIAVLAVLHQWWHRAARNDLAEPMLYAGMVALLLGWRFWWSWRARSGVAPPRV